MINIPEELICPHCGNDDKRMIDVDSVSQQTFYCEQCSKKFTLTQSKFYIRNKNVINKG